MSCNRDVSKGQLARPLARSLAPLIRSLPSSWDSGIFLSDFQSVLDHCEGEEFLSTGPHSCNAIHGGVYTHWNTISKSCTFENSYLSYKSFVRFSPPMFGCQSSREFFLFYVRVTWCLLGASAHWLETVWNRRIPFSTSKSSEGSHPFHFIE